MGNLVLVTVITKLPRAPDCQADKLRLEVTCLNSTFIMHVIITYIYIVCTYRQAEFSVIILIVLESSIYDEGVCLRGLYLESAYV